MATDGGLRSLFRKHLPKIHWTTVETGLAESGVPDLHGTLRGASFWVECKRARGWEVGLRPSQIGWLTRNARSGGRAFVAVRRSGEMWLVAGKHARRARDDGLHGLPRGVVLGHWTGGPGRWSWSAIRKILAGAGGGGRRQGR